MPTATSSACSRARPPSRFDNAQWSQGLEQKVAQRTEELHSSNALLEQRASELAIINSIQREQSNT